MTATTSDALVAATTSPRFRRLVTGTPGTSSLGHVPAFRPDLVPRPRLVRRLARDPLARLALIVAPAGYGKTTLLSEWAQRDDRPFAWISLDESHDDGDRLATAVDDALDELPTGHPCVLVLDRTHVLHDRAALDVLLHTLDTLGPGSLLAVASRREPALPLGRLRAERLIVELTTKDLAMNRVEASTLLARAG